MKLCSIKSNRKKFLLRLIYKIADPIRKTYWFVVRPHTKGVKCLVEHNGKVLLVQLSYVSSGWSIPGGGVEVGEEFVDAARRECWEELGIDAYEWRKIGEYSNSAEHKNDVIECFHTRVESPLFEIDEAEVVEAQWFDPHDLPKNVRPHVRGILRMGGLLA